MHALELIRMAQEAGFHAAVVAAKDIPVDAGFRKFCEDNLCGKYNANYACPLGCGSVEEVHQRLFSQDRALVVQMIREIDSYENEEVIQSCRKHLNRTVLNLVQKLRENGMECFGLGYGGCILCEPCKQTLDEPCPFPENRISCLSAYCIDVGKLANLCDLEFDWSPNKLFLFGMIPFRET